MNRPYTIDPRQRRANGHSPLLDSGLRRNDGLSKKEVQALLLPGELGVSPRFF